MDWHDLRVFLAVARAGSHQGAARELGVDPTTIGRRLASLEKQVGTKLLVRTPEALVLTSPGRQLRTRAERVEAEVLAGERELLAGDAGGAHSLRVTAGDGFAHYVLVPELPRLRREHPQLSLELRADANSLDLSRREADVAVRFGRPQQASLVARRLGPVRFAPYASPEYLARAGSPRTLAGLASHDFVGFDAARDSLEQVRWLRRFVAAPRYVLRVNTTTAQCLAAVAGHGIAILPDYVGEREPRLQRLLPRSAGPSRELWFVVHEGFKGSPSVAVFRDFVLGLLPS